MIRLTLIIVLIALATITHAQTYTVYTVEYRPSDNLREGCPTHLGAGCAPLYSPAPPISETGCFATEIWIGATCAKPVLTKWVRPDSLPNGCANRVGLGCANRVGLGCAPDHDAPLTSEGCFMREQFMLFDARYPEAGGMCMQRAMTRRHGVGK